MAQQTLPLSQRVHADAPARKLPFSMIERMMPQFPKIAIMGWLIVFTAFLIGLFVLAPARAIYFSDGKAIREGAAIGSAFVNANVTRHVIEAWLPSFKFFGLGLLLLSIVMALGTIAKKLRYMGKVISSNIPASQRPQMPPIPKAVRMFQISAMVGLMILLVGLISGLILAFGPVPAYWNHSVINTLNQATAGSALLTQEGVVKSFNPWLKPLRMVGMAFMFTSIAISLMVIINTLKIQATMLVNYAKQAKA